MTTNTLRTLKTLPLAALAFAGSAAHAEKPLPLDNVSVWLGGYYANTEVDLDAKTRAGDISTGRIELEEGHETLGRARVDFLLFDTQGITLDYYTLDHSATDTITQPFSYQGIPFEVNSTVTGKLDFTAASASWHWWLDAGDDVFGAGLGATYYQAKLSVAGTVELNGQTAAASARWDEDAIAPLITVAYKHAFSDALRFYVNGSGVYKNSGTLHGHIYDARGGVEWFPWHNVGLGAEYGVTRVRLDRSGDAYDATVDLKLDGPSLFARFRF